jgi:hypothetical protein
MSSTRDTRSARPRRDESRYVVFHFASTHDTISAEKLGARGGYEVEVIPRPPGTTGRCGVALQAAAADAETLAAIFAAGGLEDFHVAGK